MTTMIQKQRTSTAKITTASTSWRLPDTATARRFQYFMPSNSGNASDTPDAQDIPAMATAALARFGDRLDAQQTELLIKTARQLESAAEDLREWELSNGDEPDTSFKAIEGQDS
jgi:hypothetical protein